MGDVFPGKSGACIFVRCAVRYAEVVQWIDRSDEERNAEGPAFGSLVCFRQSAGQLSESALLGSVGVLYLVEEIGTRKFYLELVAGKGPRDGLYAA